MTEADAIRLATRIAGDFQRAQLPPAYLEATIVDDDLEESYLDVYLAAGAALVRVGRLHSERDYEKLLAEARTHALASVT